MLIAIVTTLLIVTLCGRTSSVSVDYQKTQDLIKKDVSDDMRKKQALDIVDQMEKTQEDSAKEQKKSIDSLDKLLEVRASTTEQIEAALQPLIDRDQLTSSKLLDQRFQLKTVLTADEWTEVFPAPATMPSDTPAAK
jgi:hypothetical protein